ncbi:MAG: 50S ribosomal protein L21 [Acidobacteriota bacterium]|nr:50S ribosomal protein L21 [Blastocatellia bacterium]MDW8412570.1 50S ribosomal protein L21 [Acidobacteriota bacterium]
MYAVIRTGGKQYRVTEGQTLRVPSIDAEVGATIELETLAKGEAEQLQVGAPVLADKVKAKVVEHGRGEKIIVFKFKRRKQYKRKRGHRQGFTAIKIESI